MNQTNNKTIALGLLFLGVAGAIVYFFLFKNKAAAAAPKITVPAAKPKVNVTNKIVAAYDKGLATLSEAEIKKYATWIDRILQILAQSRIERKSKYGVPNEEALSNADALTALSNDNLRAVANYWIAVRNGDLSQAFDMISDESGRLIELPFRFRDLGIIKL